MKQATAKNTAEILRKIETIEKEVLNLKLTVLKKITPSPKKIVSLKGVIKDVDVSDEDIRQAKKSLYSKIGI
ncbi:MAG: hypothetical protein A2Z46_06640 [Nitrospirae bacterium RBG_19FT_COMBO_55_12]|nr:MAG: hypothetical protein A2Z46_06640 [Nitrospirae bacterium RBG_19FT_COMBO_55_12]